MDSWWIRCISGVSFVSSGVYIMAMKTLYSHSAWQDPSINEKKDILGTLYIRNQFDSILSQAP